MVTAWLWMICYWAWVISEIVILLATRTRRGSGNIVDRGSLLILWPVIVGSLTAGIWIGETHPHTLFGGAQWVRTAALILLALGLLIRWTAIATLGKSFSANVAIYDAQTLYQTGLFRFVRHPSYSGMVLIFIAVGMHTRNWLGLVVVVVPSLLALLYRIRVEEAALRNAFGAAYVLYAAKTSRLVPGIY